MKPSKEQYAHIYTCWKHSLPPMKVAKQLQLVPLTVIKEYVRLDEQDGISYDAFTNERVNHAQA